MALKTLTTPGTTRIRQAWQDLNPGELRVAWKTLILRT
jgi:hypothetical protein